MREHRRAFLRARSGRAPISAKQMKRGRLRSGNTVLRSLFDRWESVWHEGRFDLVPDCVGPHYVRHDEADDRTVTREPTRRKSLRFKRTGQAFVSLFTTTPSKAIAHGFALHSMD